MPAFFFATAGKSAVGLVRTGNEDAAFTSNQLLAVADGMGGHAAGEVASKIAIRTLAEISDGISKRSSDPETIDALFRNSIIKIDQNLIAASEENPARAGMGTTLSALLLRSESVVILHIGDSRIYRLRGNTFEQLTVDDTVIQELLKQGAITEEEIATHPQRSVLTEVLMGEGRHLPELIVHEVKADDRFLLCSDGLSGVVAEKDIKALIKGKARGAAVDALIEAANINGAPDNVTVIIADILTNDIQEAITFLGAAK